MDILGPLPACEDNKNLLVVVDSLSRCIEAFPMSSIGAVEVAAILYNEIFCRWGASTHLVSDRGSNFMSKVVQNLCKLLDVHRVRTSSYHSASNSVCERINAEILKSLRCYCTNQEKWAKYI